MTNPVPVALPKPALGGAKFGIPEALFWLLPVLCFWVFPRSLALGNQIIISALFALSLDLMLGYAGLVSLGHAAFFGTGAYAAGLLASHGWHEPLSALVLSGAAAAIVGGLSSLLFVRVEHLGRLMVTLGLGMLLHEAANHARSLTGGVDGLPGVTVSNLLGVWEFDLQGRTAYAYSGSVCFLLFLLVRRVVHSPFGLTLRGIREGVNRMPALGSPVRTRLVQVTVISAGIAGVAGALLTQTTEFVSLEVLSFERSATVLIMLVLGGAGRLYGALWGTLCYVLLQNYFSSQSPSFWQFWLGLLVMAVALYARGGLLGGIDALVSRFKPILHRKSPVQ